MVHKNDETEESFSDRSTSVVSKLNIQDQLIVVHQIKDQIERLILIIIEQ